MARVRERVAAEIALEPGGPPTRRAWIGGRMIRLLIRSVWEFGPPGTAGLRFVRRVSERVPFVPPPRGVRLEQDDFGLFGAEWVRAGRTDESTVLLYFHGGGYFFGSPATHRGL